MSSSGFLLEIELAVWPLPGWRPAGWPWRLRQAQLCLNSAGDWTLFAGRQPCQVLFLPDESLWAASVALLTIIPVGERRQRLLVLRRAQAVDHWRRARARVCIGV